MIVNEEAVKKILEEVKPAKLVAATKYVDVKEIEKWINEYPRALFGGRSSDMLFQDELNRLAL